MFRLLVDKSLVLEKVRHLKEWNLAVELLEWLLKDEIKARFTTNVVQSAKFSELLQQSLLRYRNRAVETAQVIEELIEMVKKFQEAASRRRDPAEDRGGADAEAAALAYGGLGGA